MTSITDVDNLIACPFCGKRPSTQSSAWTNMDRIYCNNGTCSQKPTTAWVSNYSVAIEYWNLIAKTHSTMLTTPTQGPPPYSGIIRYLKQSDVESAIAAITSGIEYLEMCIAENDRIIINRQKKDRVWRDHMKVDLERMLDVLAKLRLPIIHETKFQPTIKMDET